MGQGIAVDLAGGGEEQPRAAALGQTQQPLGPRHAGHQGVLGIVLVQRRRGDAGQVVDLVERLVRDGGRQRVDHVALDQREALIAEQSRQVLAPAGQEAVQADHLRARAHQPFAQMRSEEARAARDQDARGAAGRGAVPPARLVAGWPLGRPFTSHGGHPIGGPAGWKAAPDQAAAGSSSVSISVCTAGA